MEGNDVMRAVLLLESALVCCLFLVIPRITRRGLLFGVYVGEEASAGAEARDLVDGWTRWGALALVAAIAISAAALWSLELPWSAPIASLFPIAVYLGLYVRFHLRARGLRRAYGAPTVTATPIAPVPARASHLPLFVLAACIGMALVLLAYSVQAWPRLPQRFPVHFGASGRPDGWAEKSIGSVFLLPILSLFMAVILGGTAWLVSIARRAVRADDGGRSAAAQERFRTTMTGYMAGIALLTQTMLLVLGILSFQVGLGEREGLGAIPWVFVVALLGWTFGGLAVLMARMGQGGARLEGDASSPLTGGLADDRFWKAGMIYVNREDPSILVEHRFGFGYTLNFGNRWAIVVLVLILAGPLAILAVALSI